MYYPLLRGRQFELIALRELASEEQTQGVIVPIVEPVKESVNNLILAYKVFLEKKQSIYLIVNPSVGDLAGDGNDILEFISQLDSDIIKPAFYYRNNHEYINNKIIEYQLSDCMILGYNEIQIGDVNFENLIVSQEVSHVVIEEPDRNRDLRRFLNDSGKHFIRLDDLFERQPRNSNFLDIESHMFSEEHKYYLEDRYNGFSDYTILPSEFIDGGSTPRAVVIHLTYLNERNQIWIRHFTSNTNDSIANVQGKFGEATLKAINYCREHEISNSAIEELEEYFEDAHYPGLGTVKKISIKNHLIVVSDFLRSIS